MSRIHPKNLKDGDVFYECEYGMSYQYKVVGDVQITMYEDTNTERHQWQWKGVSPDGREVDFLVTEGFEHYGPKLYSEPDTYVN